jgi:8-oxo-dGTP diphosphatase
MLTQNIYVAADSLIFSKVTGQLQLLLIKRKNEPFKGMWAFPGGFVEDHEELEAAALRELEEETGLKLSSMKQVHTFGKVGRDPRFRTISVTYWAFVNASEHPVAGGDDAAHAEWVNVADIHELAFDHMECLQLVLGALKAELQM